MFRAFKETFVLKDEYPIYLYRAHQQDFPILHLPLLQRK